jgi:acetoin utilization deacetylase AcuC-like enzyme
MSLTLVFSPRFADHLTPPGHPERAARADVMQAVVAQWSALGVPVLAPRPASREELERIHTPAYLNRIAALAGGATMLDEDTFTSPDTVDVAALAAGAAIVAVDAVLAPQTLGPSDLGPSDHTGAGFGPSDPHRSGSDLLSSLALVRPPGHHAKPGRAMGFCIYNNVAVAAAHALARGLTRVAIVDADVHHGNGTQWAFYDDPRVLAISTHQFPFYPGSGAAEEAGEGEGTGFTLNVPLEAGATDGDYRLVFERVVLPVLDAFGPQLLLVAAGFDAHMRDPIAQMAMSVAGYTALARMLRDVAARRRCPLVFVTEGGYHLRALRACLDGLVGVLDEAAERRAEALRLDRDAVGSDRDGGEQAEPLSPDEAPLVEHETAQPTHRGPAAVALVQSVQKPYWPTL